MTTAIAPISAEAVIVERLLGFTRLVRDNGLSVGTQEGLDALKLARDVGVLEFGQLRAGLRGLFCSRATDWRRFDEFFDAYWFGRRKRRLARGKGGGGHAEIGEALGFARWSEEAGSAEAKAAEEGGQFGGASPVETLSKTDFRHVSDFDELRLLHELAERLARRMRRRLSRRFRSRRQGQRIDLRKTIHRSLAYGGTPMELAHRQRRSKPVRLVILLDVSGSMSLYSTFFLRFARGVLETFREAEAFAFHTRLVHIGAELKSRDLKKALYRLALISGGWGGGTRIGESLAYFNRHYAGKLLNQRSALLIVSDGFDTGPPELLAAELKDLKRRAGTIIWLNPLLGREGYEPLAGGMAAALPHVDLFAPAHNLASLAALEPHLGRL